MVELLKMFAAGMAMGNGPCLFFCAPVVLPCIAGMPGIEEDASRWKTGLKLAVVFSLSRLFSYSVLGLMSVVLYRFVFETLGAYGRYLNWILGVLVVLLGTVYLISSGRGIFGHGTFCGLWDTKISGSSVPSMVIFGMLVGFSPCPPLLGSLTYIAATAGDPTGGLLLGFSFGLGTLLSPLILLGMLTGFMVDKIKRSGRSLLIIRAISAAVLIYFGARVMGIF